MCSINVYEDHAHLLLVLLEPAFLTAFTLAGLGALGSLAFFILAAFLTTFGFLAALGLVADFLTGLVFLAVLAGTDTATVVATVVVARGFLVVVALLVVVLAGLAVFLVADLEALLLLETDLDVFLAME